VLLLFPLGGYAQNPVKDNWVVGDVFAATGNGSTQVWHSTNPGANNPTYSVVQTLNDGTAGPSPGSGCAFDSAYRLFTTTTNFTPGPTIVPEIIRFTIDDAHPIAQTITGGATSGFRNIESVAFDGTGNFYVGYAAKSGSLTGGGLEKYDHTGALKGSFTPTVENGGVDWLDVAQDGVTIFYTSKGRNIYAFNTQTGVSSVWANLSKFSGELFAIRVVPGGPSNAANGVLVADQTNVKLVTKNVSGVVSVQSFNFGGNNNLQALGLDPSLPNRAWVGDASTNTLMRFNFLTGKKEVTLSTGTATPGGICVEGGFSAGQISAFPAPANSAPTTKTFALTPTANTVFFTSPFTGAKFTLTLVDLQNNLTATLRDSLVDPSVAQSDQTVVTLIPGSNGAGGTQETNMPCDQTLTIAAGFPNTCEIFEFETNSDTSLTTKNLQIDKPAALVETTPNLRMLRDFDEDITDGVINYPLRSTSCSTCKSVFSVNQQTSNPALEICGGGFSSVTKNQNSTISFKFKVSPTGTCPNGASPADLLPLLVITQTQKTPDSNGIIPAPVQIPVIVAGNSGGLPLFLLTGNTWQLQIKTTDMPGGFNYVATMIDLKQKIPSIGVNVDIQ